MPNTDRNEVAARLRVARRAHPAGITQVCAAYPNAQASQWTVVGFLVGIMRTDGGTQISLYNPSGIRP